jgi:hypothetical protein
MARKISVCQIQLKPIPNPTSGELSEKVYRRCSFCEKTCEISSNNSQIINRLSGPGNFYCSFCLRHNLNNKGNRDVLILSFRSIIGCFYFQNYLQSVNGQKLWISEIEDYISCHQKAGEENPVFLYDPETMFWFINFSKVGIGKRKIPVDSVLKTIVSILDSFNLSENIPDINTVCLYQKYKSAIDLFYQKRHRPDNRRMLIPSLTNTGVIETKLCSLEKMRNFSLEDLKLKK